MPDVTAARTPGGYTPPLPPRPFEPCDPLPSGTVLLEASAGTGKTYSIASAVLRLVAEEGVAVDRVLVVTFTRAATAELRGRIRARLRDAQRLAEYALGGGTGRPDGAPDDRVASRITDDARARGTLGTLVVRLRAAVERFDELPVSTIDGFWQRVLREHAAACGADADAELLPDQSALVDEVVRDFWASETARRPEAEVRALATVGGVSLAGLRALARAALADGDAACTPAAPDAVDPFDMTARAHAAGRAAFAALCGTEDGRHAHDAFETIDAALARKALNANSWRHDTAEKLAMAVTTWVATDCAGPPPDKLRMLGPEELAKKTKKGHTTPTHPLFDAAGTLVEAEARLTTAAAVEALRLQHAFVAHVRAEVARRKRERGLAGYDDVLARVRGALRADGETLGAALRARYDVVLVDEFQDTNAAQWEVFQRAFGGGHRLVLIGDPKQSIFRFRGADVHAYLDAREAAATAPHGGGVFALTTNRRTDAALVDALERAFGAHEAPFAGGDIRWSRVAAFHTDARCRTRRDRAVPPLAAPLTVRYVAAASAPEPPEDRPAKHTPMSKGTLLKRLPALVAADVVRFLDRAELWDDERHAFRRARPSDAAVLVDSHARAAAVHAALRDVGVPAVTRAAASVFASAEARDLAVVLAAVLEPRSASLRAALATDLLGVAAGEEIAPGAGLGPGDVLALVRAADSGATASDAVLDSMPDDAPDGTARTAADLLDRWAERFGRWRDLWRGAGAGGRTGRAVPNVMRVVRAMSDDLALPARVLALHDGERRLTNLRHTAELVHAAAVEGALGPDATLAWLRAEIARADDARGRCDDEARQQRLETDADAVQVVTIHASKGLEYGAVWAPYLWEGLSDRKAAAHPCVRPATAGADTPDVGAPAARVLHLVVGKSSEGAALDADEAFAERLRLAYVALTRARHQVTLWWADVSGRETSPLGWLLHGEGVDDPRAARLALTHALATADDAALWDRLVAWRAAAGPGVAVLREDGADPPTLPWTPDASAPDAVPAVRAYAGPARLDADGWRLGSFTGLTRGAGPHRAAAFAASEDVERPEALGDARAAGAGADVDAESPGAEVPLAEFPASAAAGICFHEILEHHDFADHDGLAARVHGGLATHGFDAARWEAAVAGALRATLAARVPDPGDPARAPLQLDRVPRARALTELRFELPACDGEGDAITPTALAAVFAAHPGGGLGADRMPAYAAALRALDFRPLRGFLTGVLDLLVEQHGRWWVVDWKSNRLGRHAADYAPAAVLDEMTGAHYVLQYHLYVLAAHRWLRLRVRDYDYDRDVAGACYLFVRGIAPDASTPDASAADGAMNGVFTDHPPRARIEALDRLFRGGAAASPNVVPEDRA